MYYYERYLCGLFEKNTAQVNTSSIHLHLTTIGPQYDFPEDTYGESIKEISAGGKDIYVISDLHLAAGINANSNYDGTENFFADKSFARFVQHIIQNAAGKTSLLIINGDLIDFLRIRNIPEANDIAAWQQALKNIGIEKTAEELQSSITKKEIEFGLKTNDYKSVWKLLVSARGHTKVFESLAEWISNGNELIILKGNHDLEWYWKAVRDYFKLLLAENSPLRPGQQLADVLKESIVPYVIFVDNALLIDKKIYLEHGHRYENFTNVDGPAVLEGTAELNLPFGSFFNRYLINQIELSYPHIDDVRPRQNILPVLLRERFPLAIKMLFCYIPFTALIIPKKQYAYALRYLFQFLLIIVLPVAVTIFAVWRGIQNPVKTGSDSGSAVLNFILPTIKNLGFLSLSYFLGRLMEMLQLSAPGGLFKNATAVFDNNPNVQIATFGHTHNPEQRMYGSVGKRYYNTGTWMPVFEADAMDVRIDKTYTFLYLPNAAGSTDAPYLMRWNDDALRTEPLVLIDRK